jgi:hypothetical protein
MYVEPVRSPSYALNYITKYLTTEYLKFETENAYADYVVALEDHRIISKIGTMYGKTVTALPRHCPDCHAEIIFCGVWSIFSEKEPIHPTIPPPLDTSLLRYHRNDC